MALLQQDYFQYLHPTDNISGTAATFCADSARQPQCFAEVAPLNSRSQLPAMHASVLCARPVLAAIPDQILELVDASVQ